MIALFIGGFVSFAANLFPCKLNSSLHPHVKPINLSSPQKRKKIVRLSPLQCDSECEEGRERRKGGRGRGSGEREREGKKGGRERNGSAWPEKNRKRLDSFY